MVKLSHDVLFQPLAHLIEVDNHALMVQGGTIDGDLNEPVVSVRMGTFAIVVQKTVTVTEMDALNDSVQSILPGYLL